MRPTIPLQRRRSASSLAALFVMTIVSWPAISSAGAPPPNWVVHSRKWDMLVTDYGYADLALDQRCGFEGREYLSGEWAAAVYYEGGMLPAMTRWLTPMFIYPDWTTAGPHFGVEKSFGLADPFTPTNMYGNFVYSSIITNSEVRITMTYEMLKFSTNRMDRVALGLTPKSLGGLGSNLWSGRSVFRQNYRFENISGGTLNNFRYYQLLHALNSGFGVYDDRSYGGALPDYHYSITQQGKSYSFDTRSGETVQHTDTLALTFNRQPFAFELGYYGLKDTDNHQLGKPSVGAHLSVEANSLNGVDYMNPSGTGWVSGAVSFNLGSLGPNETASIDALLSIHTSYEVKFPPLNLIVHSAQIMDGKYAIDFEETTGNPVVGWGLFKSTELTTDQNAWEQEPVPYFRDYPKPGWNRFEVPVDPATVPQCFFNLRALIQ